LVKTWQSKFYLEEGWQLKNKNIFVTLTSLLYGGGLDFQDHLTRFNLKNIKSTFYEQS